jgi:hypothetical protein
MSVRLQERSDGSFVCGNHQDKKVVLMLASVPIPRGCEECIRAAFAEALEQSLRETREAANQNR